MSNRHTHDNFWAGDESPSAEFKMTGLSATTALSARGAGPTFGLREAILKTLFIIYHEDLEAEIRSVLHRRMVLPRYTRIDNVVGARMVEMEAESGYMTDRRNRVILIVAEDATITKLAGELRRMRDTAGHGLRGFVIDTSMVF